MLRSMSLTKFFRVPGRGDSMLPGSHQEEPGSCRRLRSGGKGREPVYCRSRKLLLEDVPCWEDHETDTGFVVGGFII